MKPSKYQQAVLDAVLNDTCNLMIGAVAGSGKTATLKMICEQMAVAFPRLSILALAFNKEIALALGEKLPASVVSKTMHSLGSGILRDNLPAFTVDAHGKKQAKALEKMFGETRKLEPKMKKYTDILLKLVSKVRNTCTSTNNWSDIEAMAVEYDVDLDVLFEAKLPTAIAADVEALCKALRAERTTIDFDDMLDFPVHYQLKSRQSYDLVLVDESQDLNRLQAEFLSLLLGSKPAISSFSALDDLLGDVGITAAKPKAVPSRPTMNRVVLVGDVRQAIYKFRGADSKSMANLATTFGARQLPLSICYRCPLSVVRKARTVIGPIIEPSLTAEEGEVVYNESGQLDQLIADLKSGDMVMSRTNAPLLGLALRCVRAGKKVVIRGNLDVGLGLIKLIQDICKRYDASSMPEFTKALEEHTNEQIVKAIDDDKANIATRWGEKYECIIGLAEQMKSVDELTGFLSRIFNDKSDVGIIFSSIHRAKGLEADHAVILQPEKLPHPMSYRSYNVEAALEQERNLAYVAVTRAMKKLTLQPLPNDRKTPFPRLQLVLDQAADRRAMLGVEGGIYGDFLSADENDELPDPLDI